MNQYLSITMNVTHPRRSNSLHQFKQIVWCTLAVTLGCMTGGRAGSDVAHGMTIADRPVTSGTSAAVTAIVDVAIVPMDSERVLAHQTVLMAGGHITALGPTPHIKIPVGAIRIDGRGKFLIPGLADMHAHLETFRTTGRLLAGDAEVLAQSEHMLFLMVANGVTTVRVMYAWPQTLRLKERAARGELLSPRIYAGKVSNPDLSRDTMSFVAYKDSGYDFLKIPADGYRAKGAQFNAYVAAARRAGLQVAGHVLPQDAMQAGVASIEHLVGFSELLVGVESWGRGQKTWRQMTQHPIDETKLRSLAAEMKQHGVWNCPTQMLYEINLLGADSLDRWPEMVYVSDQTRQDMRTQVSISASSTALSEALPAMRERRKAIRMLRDAGAGLLLGTDVSVGYMVPGFAVHRELEALVKAGLTPYEALTTSTRNVAEFFGTLDSTGTIAVGKRADVVLLAGNPLQDIRHTANPAGVMLGTRWLSRAELDERLNALKGRVF